MLRLQSETIALPVFAIACSIKRAVQRIARIELNSRLVGPDIKSAMRNRLENAGCKAQLPRLRIYYPVEVEAAAMDQLGIVASDIGGNRFFRPEVEHGPDNGPQGAVRDLAAGDRSELIGVDPHQVRVDSAGSFTGQIPVGVVSQVDDGGRVSGRRIVDDKLVTIV